MIEPTETESRESIELLAEALVGVAEEAKRDVASLTAAPSSAPIGRLDEVRAARQPDLRWRARLASEAQRTERHSAAPRQTNTPPRRHATPRAGAPVDRAG